MSSGWRKSKMSEAAVQELENLGLLQAQGDPMACGRGRRLPYGRYPRDRCIPWLRGTWSCTSCIRIFLWSSAILGNPTASFDSSIHFASFHFYPFLWSIPWHSSPFSCFSTLFHSYSHSEFCQTRRYRGLWISTSSWIPRRVLGLWSIGQRSRVEKILVSCRKL